MWPGERKYCQAYQKKTSGEHRIEQIGHRRVKKHQQ